jgi:hypothetical protein
MARSSVLGVLALSVIGACSDPPRSSPLYRTLGSAGSSSVLDSAAGGSSSLSPLEQAGEAGEIDDVVEPPFESGGYASTPTNSGGWTPPPACGGAPSSGWGPSGCSFGGSAGTSGSSSGGSPSAGQGGALIGFGGQPSSGGSSGAPQGGTGGAAPGPYCCGTILLNCVRDDPARPVHFVITYSQDKYGKYDKDGNLIYYWHNGSPVGPEGQPLAGQLVTDSARCGSKVTVTDTRYEYHVMPYRGDLPLGSIQDTAYFPLGNDLTFTIPVY